LKLKDTLKNINSKISKIVKVYNSLLVEKGMSLSIIKDKINPKYIKIN